MQGVIWSGVKLKKKYDNKSVLLKLIFYCNFQKEVYFKRSEVTEFLISKSIFDIPNKQGFDGNLSYFGYDIQNDSDNDRILLLRGNKLNEKCLNGQIKFKIDDNDIEIEINDDENIVFNEIDNLIKTKTLEAGFFNTKKEINNQLQLKECKYRVFGNKKIFIKENKHYYYPRVLFDIQQNKIIYEIVNSPQLIDYNPIFIFPQLTDNFVLKNKLFFEYEYFYYNETLGSNEKDFYYFIENAGHITEIDIQDESNNEIINLVNNYKYDLSDKETTKKVLTNSRLNTGTLRSMALSRDNHQCLLCDINDDRLLICSHIKPWRTGESRLDLNNVLTLCEFHDSLFDKGFISLNDNGKLVHSNTPVLKKSLLRIFLEGTKSRIALVNNDKMKYYLKFHRENVFMKNSERKEV